MTTYPKIIQTISPNYPKRTLVTEGSFPQRELVTSGVFPKVRIVEEEGYPKVLLPTLLDQATAVLNGIEPLHYWDFTQDRALFAGSDVGALASTPNWTLTRATVGTAETSAGAIVEFASGELRRTDRGVLLEGARTNLFLNSATGVTQNVAVTAVAHTLSFRGTGTITLSGASTAGPLVGTGANTRVTLTFTPSAATLTLTVTGSVTNVQLEVGAFATSWIPTAGASVTRDADLLTVTSPGVAPPMSMFAHYERVVDPGAQEVLIRIDDGGTTESVTLVINGTSDLAQIGMNSGGVSQASPTVAGVMVAGTTYKMAGRYATNSVQVCRDGILGVEDTVATAATGLTTIRIGSSSVGINQPHGYLRRLAVFNSALSDANLQTITTS